jgi:hypothetical protein
VLTFLAVVARDELKIFPGIERQRFTSSEGASKLSTSILQLAPGDSTEVTPLSQLHYFSVAASGYTW